jgi:hypothetical protein
VNERTCDVFVGLKFAVALKVETAVLLLVIIFVLVDGTGVSEGLFYAEDRSSKF